MAGAQVANALEEYRFQHATKLASDVAKESENVASYCNNKEKKKTPMKWFFGTVPRRETTR